MADYWYKLGQGSIVLRVKLRDTASAQAAGKTGLAYNTSGLSIAVIADNEASGAAYTAAGSTIEAVSTLGTYAAPTATKCRFSEVDATNHKGLYEIQIADAKFAVASSKSVAITIQCGTVIFERTIIIPLQTFDVYSAVPNTNAAYVGGVEASEGMVSELDNAITNNTLVNIIRNSGVGEERSARWSSVNSRFTILSGTNMTSIDVGRAAHLINQTAGTDHWVEIATVGVGVATAFTTSPVIAATNLDTFLVYLMPTLSRSDVHPCKVVSAAYTYDLTTDQFRFATPPATHGIEWIYRLAVITGADDVQHLVVITSAGTDTESGLTYICVKPSTGYSFENLATGTVLVLDQKLSAVEMADTTDGGYSKFVSKFPQIFG